MICNYISARQRRFVKTEALENSEKKITIKEFKGLFPKLQWIHKLAFERHDPDMRWTTQVHWSLENQICITIRCIP